MANMDEPMNEVGDTKWDFWMQSLVKSLDAIAGSIEELKQEVREVGERIADK